MAPPRSTRTGSSSRKWPASALVAVYSVLQCVLSGYLALDGSTNRDAHAIARGVLHFLSCLVLLCGALIRLDDSVLLALAASLSILVDGGVRALAAATSLTTTTRRYSVDGVPPYIVYTQVAASLGGTLLFHVLPRYWGRNGNNSSGGINKSSNNTTMVIPPLYVSARAHAFSTLLVRMNVLVPYGLYSSSGDLMQLLYACVALAAASHSAQFAAAALLRLDPAVAAARRALHDTVGRSEFAKVWRDESGAIRAVVNIRSRENNITRDTAKSRIRSALAGLVDDLYVQVEAVQPAIVRSTSSSQALS